jgi:O-antigen/teichoic acid export membrane protein
MQDLKERTLRGGFAKLCGQGANVVLRLGFVVVLARVLDPEDFGLVAMVTVVTGFYELFTSAGLSTAAVQRESITNEQISTLFWTNVLVGTILCLLCIATAPVLVAFYHEPRLFWVTIAMSVGFLFNAAGVQHFAILQRQLRYVVITLIETLSQLVGVAVGIAMAFAGFGLWALVGATIVTPVINTVCMWTITAWIPGKLSRRAEVRSMLYFGGTLTLNGLIIYAAYNLEKVLLGRYWGADALGLYSRAYQLINLPTANLNSAIGGVVFSALSRLQNDPVRLRNYFLKGYYLVVSMTLPITIFSALFANDIILVVLGPKWTDATIVFRLMTPTILIFGMINPLTWLLFSIGLQGRSLKVALVIAPLVVTAYIVGLPHGPAGVAFAYSTAMTVWFIPHIMWCLKGTMISPWDLFRAVRRPFLSAVAATIIGLGFKSLSDEMQIPLLRLLLGGGVTIGSYLCILMFRQKALYLELISGLRGAPSLQAKEPE